MLRKICLLFCTFFIAGCMNGAPDTDRQAAMADEKTKQEKDYEAFLYSETPANEQLKSMEREWKDWEATNKTKRISANLFPAATSVRVYQGELNLKISDDGKATTQKYVRNANSYPEVPAKNGGYLSSVEIKTLREGVFYTLSPPAVAACCIPRHGFLFYDKTGKYLGYLQVCYECGCAQISPPSPHDPELNWINWDAAALKKIIEAHHLTIKPKH